MLLNIKNYYEIVIKYYKIQFNTVIIKKIS